MKSPNQKFPIPPIIHYCRFPNANFSRLERFCISTWKKHLPHYEFRFWSMHNIPEEVLQIPYVRLGLRQRKWIMISDYFRHWVVYHYGGIYLDCDIQIFRNFDSLRRTKAFVGIGSTDGFEGGLFGATSHHPLFLSIIRTLGSMKQMITAPIIQERILTEKFKLKRHEAQTLGDITIYPSRYFMQYEWFEEHKRHVLWCHRKDFYFVHNPYAHHWCAGSWVRSKTLKKIIKTFHSFRIPQKNMAHTLTLSKYILPTVIKIFRFIKSLN